MKVNRVLVPVKGSKVDEEAVHLACTWLARGGTIYLLYVVEMHHAVPVDLHVRSETDKAQGVLDGLEKIARAHRGAQVERAILQAREAGTAVTAEVHERKADLVVMGVDYKLRYGEFTLGRAAPYVLKHAPCRVVLIREPMPVYAEGEGSAGGEAALPAALPGGS